MLRRAWPLCEAAGLTVRFLSYLCIHMLAGKVLLSTELVCCAYLPVNHGDLIE